MSIGLYIVLVPRMLKICKKLQEKRFVFVKILAIIIPENGAKVSKIKCLRLNQQTLINNAVREFNSSRRNEYTQLMINIYKYAKGENADYELVIGNSMRRVMEAYGSFMYKKGIEQLSTASEIKQKLEPPFGDHFENLMYRLVLHGGSHNEERVKSMVSDDFFDYISSEEKIRTAKEILVFLYTLDDQHVIEHLKRDLNGKTLNDVQTDLETWKQEILSLISLDE